jgi:hypothetical protein
MNEFPSQLHWFVDRTFHPVERSDDLVVFDHEGNNGDVSVIPGGFEVLRNS